MTKRRLILVVSFALLLALPLFTAAAQSFPNIGVGSTHTELANKTANPAQVTIVYYDQNGNMVPGTSPNIPGNGSIGISAASSGLPQNFNGAGVASSNEPLAAVVQTDWINGPGDGYELGLYSGVSAGSTAICFPSLWKVQDAIISSFAVQNTGTSTVAVSIAYTSRTGTGHGTFNDNIPAGAQHTYNLATPGATVPNLPLDWEGSARVTVNGAGSVAGVAVVSWGGVNPAVSRADTYNAADCAGVEGATTLVVPTHFRVRPNPDWTGGIWSAVNVQNLSGSTANIQLTYTSRVGNPAPLVLNTTIPPFSTVGANTRTGGNFPASAFNPLDVNPNWDGSVTIVSDQPVVATVITQWNRAGRIEAGVYAAANKAGGATTYFVPNIKRRNPGTWEAWSATIVQNLGAANANVNLKYYNRNGTLALEFNDTIAPDASLGYNTRTGGSKPSADFNPLGTAFEGHVVVTSSQPIAVVLNGLAAPGNASGSGTTNGVP